MCVSQETHQRQCYVTVLQGVHQLMFNFSVMLQCCRRSINVQRQCYATALQEVHQRSTSVLCYSAAAGPSTFNVSVICYSAAGGPSTFNLTDSCNVACSCEHAIYEPICSLVDNVQYYSPCHAGCAALTNKSHSGGGNNEVTSRLRPYICISLWL